MYLKLYLVLNLSIFLINHEEICKKYENEKQNKFNRTEFRDSFQDLSKNSKDEVYIENYFYDGKKKGDSFKKFKMTEKGRQPLIFYSKELIERRTKEILKVSKDPNIKQKINRFNLIIEKSLEYLKNSLLIYSKPIENFTLNFSYKHLNLNYLKKFFSGKEKIRLDRFDYFIFFDFVENNPSSIASNFIDFSYIKYNSRPVVAMIEINLAYLNNPEVKYEEITTVVHEIIHSFGLVSKNKDKIEMDKLSNLDDDNKIKLYIQKHNDFYKLYKYLDSNNLLEKLYSGGHFNPVYLYNDLMQPTKVIINHFTYFSAGLLEILTGYEFRVNRKILRKNYETCLPILKILFKNNCDSEIIRNQKNNVFKSLDSSKDIVLNNKCNKSNENIVDDQCDTSFQRKLICNFNLGGRNPHCYRPVTHGNSNCYDSSNNWNSNGFEYYGKQSNCFLIQNVAKKNYFKSFCLKNVIDIVKSRIRIKIKVNKKVDEEIEIHCNYEKKYDEELKENVYQKKNHFVTFRNKRNKEFKIKCPDMNKFYKNNIPNLCENDCNLNGRCIGINKCECYRGYNKENNCKTLLPRFANQTNNKFDYTFLPGEDNSLNSSECLWQKNIYYKFWIRNCTISAEKRMIKFYKNFCDNQPGCFENLYQEYLKDKKNRCTEEYRDNEIRRIENRC